MITKYIKQDLIFLNFQLKLKALKDNGFKFLNNNSPYHIVKNKEEIILFASDFQINQSVEEFMIWIDTQYKCVDLNYKQIEDYAKRLFENKCYKTYEKAYDESLRWHKKEYRGLTEPMKC